MKDLNKFGVQELNAKEIKETQGGLLFLTILGAAAAVAGIVYLAGEIAYMKGRSDGNCDPQC